MSTGEWNPTQQSRVGTVYRMEGSRGPRPSRPLPLFPASFFEISEFSQENPRVGANPPVLSAAAKKSGTGARLQRRLVALEDVYRREGVAGEKRARAQSGDGHRRNPRTDSFVRGFITSHSCVPHVGHTELVRNSSMSAVRGKRRWHAPRTDVVGALRPHPFREEGNLASPNAMRGADPSGPLSFSKNRSRTRRLPRKHLRRS